MTTSISMTFPYPEDGQLFRCPVCQLSYKMFTSLTRHLSAQHPGRVEFTFKCGECSQCFSTKRSISIHYGRAHPPGQRSPSSIQCRTSTISAAFQCSYCSESLPSKRSLGQHVRNQHAAEASKDRAEAAANTTCREWSPAEHARFLDALEKYGPDSNVRLAAAVATKSTKQVANHKRVFLRNNPNWISHHPPPVATRHSTADSEEDCDPALPEPGATPASDVTPPCVTTHTPDAPTPGPGTPPRSGDGDAAPQGGSGGVVSDLETMLLSCHLSPSPSPVCEAASGSRTLCASQSVSSHLSPSPVCEAVSGSRTLCASQSVSSHLSPSPVCEAASGSRTLCASQSVSSTLSPSPVCETAPGSGTLSASQSVPFTCTPLSLSQPFPTVTPPASSAAVALNPRAALFVPSQQPVISVPPLSSPVSGSPSLSPSVAPSLPSAGTSSGPAHVSVPSPDDLSNSDERPAVPEDQQATAREEQREDAAERLKVLRGQAMTTFSDSYGHLLGRPLSDDDWALFVAKVDALLEDLSQLVSSRRTNNPTAPWRQRNGARMRAGARRNSANSRHPRRRSSLLEEVSPLQEESTLDDSTQSEAPASRRGRHRRRRAAQAKRLQQLYRANKKRCMRDLLGEEKKSCPIEPQRLFEHFSVPAARLGEATPAWIEDINEPAPPGSEADMTSPVEVSEVAAQLRRLPWQSAPGPDSVPYQLWKATPESAELLTELYNTCLVNHKIPPSWKASNTCLIYKKGDESVPKNWRPISLQPTVYKIMAAVLAKRLASWAITNKKISTSQKGFLPMEGCAEHCFLMESLLCDSKRRRKNLRILWLDLKNAFGSVSHDLLWEMMRRLGVPLDFTTLCQEIYSGSSQRVRCEAGWTDDIPITVGIKQGCPLSPLLFNLALEGLLRELARRGTGYRFENGSCVGQLAYADDLCLVAETKEELEEWMEVVTEFTGWSHLSLNVGKCGCLSMINRGSRGRYVEPFSPLYGSEPIPALKWEDTYKYLGVEIGRPRSGKVDPLLQQIEELVDTILGSLLTDWQKVDAINTFAMSKLTYALNSSTLNRSWAARLDAIIRRKLKKAIRLPVRTTSNFFHLPTHMGGLGLFSVEDALESSMVMRTLKYLTSRDLLVSSLAWDQLIATMLKRTGNQPSDATEALSFLNTPPPRGEYAKGDVRSLWSMVRNALKYLGLSLEHGDEDSYFVTSGESAAKAGKWKAVAAVLRKAREQRRLTLMLECKDQGRSFHLLSQSQSSNHWIAGGNYTSFAEYRFAIRGRLNLLPVKTVVKRAGKNINTTCPKCKSQPESLGHVLNACTPNTGLMRERHNAVLRRLVKAVRKEGKDVFVEQSISPDNLRPDLVVRDQETRQTVVVDVTIPYEASDEAFSKARAEKLQKYEGLRRWMENQTEYSTTTVYPFVVGSLGGWDNNNTAALRALGIARNYSVLFSKLCCTDAIKGSLAIWKARSSPRSSS